MGRDSVYVSVSVSVRERECVCGEEERKTRRRGWDRGLTPKAPRNVSLGAIQTGKR